MYLLYSMLRFVNFPVLWVDESLVSWYARKDHKRSDHKEYLQKVIFNELRIDIPY